MIDHFPVEILSLIWLRYLSLLCHENLVIPPEICRLWNLQTLIVKGNLESSVDIKCPVQIWGLMQLRHLKLRTFYLPDCPSGSVDKGRHLDFSNLQTISYLSSRCCTKDVILGIQNVKKFGIRQDVTDYGCYRDSGPLNNLIHLHQLETLSFTSCYSETFPATLNKLKLERTLISWSNLRFSAADTISRFVEEVLSGIQNIKKLCIRGHVYDYDMREEVMDIREIVDLHQLETLSIKVDRYHVSHWSSRSHKSTVCVPNATYFPTELKKLKLVGTRLAWEDLNIIGQWPNFEVLKQKPNACRGLEWRPIEGGFHRSELHYWY
ncbi:hypothetical protein CQW23_28763 [Capsicum baccatum]|uniref:Spondin domain-containing protein n=1 Tax=Capsicum baccatum TaxID=33114 RepID=A0A2G2VHF7_CAPBA|nr:hypothetical protein CQW23_28763 [Capsicum baccatum]